MLSPGDKIGPYTIRERAGAGGMATVYKAWHDGLHRHEALKVPRGAGEAGADSAYVLRLLSEARVAARLNHPNIVSIHNVSEVDASVPFFAMDWVDGEDLSQILKLKKQFSLNETVEILEPVARALDYAHSQGVVHRDVKPANVLLENKRGQWIPHVVDFGISRAAEDEDGATKLTKSGMLVGTPEYMSPEQSGSGEVVDFRTDIYSLGIVAYEMICGTPPFTAGQGVSRLSILVAHVNKQPPIFQLYPDFSKNIGEVLLRVLEKSPQSRPQSCVEFIAELKAVASQEEDSNSPLILSDQDNRTPFDGSRFVVDNDATLMQLIGEDVKEFQPPPSESNFTPETTSVSSASAFMMTDTSGEDLQTLRSEPNLTRETITTSAERTPDTLPLPNPPQQNQKTNRSKLPLLAGLLALVLVVGAVASLSVQRLGLSGSETPTPVQPTPSVEVTLSQPSETTIPRPKVSTRTLRVTRMREVPFETETRTSRRRAFGQTSIIQQGRPGTREVVLSIKMEGDREVSRSKVSERDVLQPVKRIVEVGTRQRSIVRRPRVRSERNSGNNGASSNAGKQQVTPVKKAVKTPGKRDPREAPLPP